MSDFYLDLPVLGPEYSASFLVQEYFDRFLRDRKGEFFQHIDDKRDEHLNANKFKKLVSDFIEDEENYKTYLGEFGKILEADSDEDWSKCHDLFVNNLVNECMVRWFQSLMYR